MSEVLTDLYSLFEFNCVFERKVKSDKLDIFQDNFSLIENLILCEKIVTELNGVSYHKLNNICSEFSDAFRFIEDRRLYDRTPFEETVYIGDDISQRGVIYADVAKENDIYYSPHPVRERALTNQLKACIDQTAKSVIEQFDQKFNASRSGVVSNINVKIPPVVEHVLYFAKAQNISISDSINEIRNSKNAALFRHYFSELDAHLRELSPRKKIPVYQKLFKEIDQLCNSWVEDMDVEVRYRRRRINLTKVPIIGKLFEVVGLSELTIDDPIIRPDKPHLLFVNELYQK